MIYILPKKILNDPGSFQVRLDCMDVDMHQKSVYHYPTNSADLDRKNLQAYNQNFL